MGFIQNKQVGKEEPALNTRRPLMFTLSRHPPFDVLHDTHAPSVTPPGDHAHVSDLELDGLDRLAGLEVHLDRVVHLDNHTIAIQRETQTHGKNVN